MVTMALQSPYGERSYLLANGKSNIIDGNQIVNDAAPTTVSSTNKSSNIYNNNKNNRDKQVFGFYMFICLSTAFRAFEAGIVSSMMGDIKDDLELNYTQEGTITASPDYGIAPGALLAIVVFRHFASHSKTILLVILWGAALVAMACAVRPTQPTLIVARALGGLFWAHAATHYPVWIDRQAPPSRRTIWLACTNISLLVGVIAGYLVGGASRAFATRTITWVQWYFVAGVLMAICAIIVGVCFDSDLVNVQSKQPPQQSTCHNDNTPIQQREKLQQPQLAIANDDMLNGGIHAAKNEANNDSTDFNEVDDDFHVMQVVGHLFESVPFVLSVAITGCISGGIVFALYFAAQTAEARGIDKSTTFVLVMVVFLTAPAPGVMFGSWVVHSLGGYTDHVATFGVALASALVVLAAATALPLSWILWGENGSVPFVLAFWMFAFAGAMAGPPMNGVAVSAVPHASHVASAIQFAIANAAKIVVPQIGGFVCNRIGLINGFHSSLVVTAAIFVFISWIGLIHSKKMQRQLANTV